VSGSRIETRRGKKARKTYWGETVGNLGSGPKEVLWKEWLKGNARKKRKKGLLQPKKKKPEKMSYRRSMSCVETGEDTRKRPHPYGCVREPSEKGTPVTRNGVLQ